MLGRLRALWRAHLSGQREIVSELRRLNAGLEQVAGRLEAVESRLGAAEALGADVQGARSRAEDAARLLTMIERRLAQEERRPVAVCNHVASIVAADGRHADPLSLPRYHAQVYSQNGEDGIVAEIFRRIGTRSRTFVEIGIEGGIQNNTRFLLEQGWRGVWVEGHPGHAAEASERMKGAIADGRLRVVCGMASPEGVNALLDEAGVPAEIDFLSLDIDQHTTHVWRALARHTRVACLEYNASIPASAAVEVPYDSNDAWAGTNWFGGGLKTIELIGAAKGMHLVGCDALGVNAFLVDAGEAAGKFREPFTAEAHYQPPMFSLVSHMGHPSPENERTWKAAVEADS